MKLSLFLWTLALLGVSSSGNSTSLSDLLVAVDISNGKCFEPSDGTPIEGVCSDATKPCIGDGVCATCANNKCECIKDRFRQEGQTCIGNVRIGESCIESPEQCVDFHIGGSKCFTDVCQCEEDYYASLDFMRCLKKVDAIGLPCVEDVQCQKGTPGPESRCVDKSGTKVCDCKEGAVSDGRTMVCHKIAKLVGDSCEIPAQCETDLHAICKDKICACNEDHVARPDNGICLPRVFLADGKDVCEYDVQCIVNATCQPVTPGSNKGCLCRNGYGASPTYKICFKFAESVNDPCVPDANHPDQCNRVRGTECKANGTCGCLDGYKSSLQNTHCVRIAPDLGDACEEDQQCDVSNSFCAGSKTCTCKAGFVEINKNECAPIRYGLNQDCVYHKQCTEGLGTLSECSDIIKKCLCKTIAKPYDEQCYVPVQFGKTCHFHEECWVGTNNWTLCYKKDASDEFKQCICHPDANLFGDKCYIKKKLGDACTSETECAVYVGNSFCNFNTGTCSCKQGYKEDPSKLLCSAGNGLVYQNISILACIFVLLSTSIFK